MIANESKKQKQTNMKTLPIPAITALLFFASNNLLTGRWESQPSEKGNVTGVVFKSDSTFEGYVNKKPFVSGVYRFGPEDSLFSFTDNGCNGVEGRYKVLFFSHGDSLKFRALSDNCEERKAGMQRLVLGRVKAN